MPEPVSTPDSLKKKERPPEPKVVVLKPQAGRKISTDFYFPTDRYKLNDPLYPDPEKLKTR